MVREYKDTIIQRGGYGGYTKEKTAVMPRPPANATLGRTGGGAKGGRAGVWVVGPTSEDGVCVCVCGVMWGECV